MGHKYGIYQSSNRSCVFYKQDEDGNQSTFNIFVKPKEHEADVEKIIAFIDNDQVKKENWTKTEITDLKDVLEAFGGWATDAPIVFELEAHKSLSHCLHSVLKKKENE
jgi:hypothetical protein